MKQLREAVIMGRLSYAAVCSLVLSCVAATVPGAECRPGVPCENGWRCTEDFECVVGQVREELEAAPLFSNWSLSTSFSESSSSGNAQVELESIEEPDRSSLQLGGFRVSWDELSAPDSSDSIVRIVAELSVSGEPLELTSNDVLRFRYSNRVPNNCEQQLGVQVIIACDAAIGFLSAPVITDSSEVEITLPLNMFSNQESSVSGSSARRDCLAEVERFEIESELQLTEATCASGEVSFSNVGL